jgi:opacity protein-like surface antigen
MRDLLAAVALTAFLATPAMAGDVSGFYVGIYGGGALRNSADADYSNLAAGFVDGGSVEHPTQIINEGGDPRLVEALNGMLAGLGYASEGGGEGTFIDGKLDFDPGFVAGGVLGYSLGNGVRVELDYAHTRHAASDSFPVKSIGGYEVLGGLEGDDWIWTDPGNGGTEPGTVPASVKSLTGGSTIVTSADFLLINGWYDFDTGTVFSPYLGGGLGLARISSVASSDCGCNILPLTGERTALAPAAQLGGGVRVKLSDPISLDLGYRLKLAGGTDLTFRRTITDGEGTFFQFGLGQHGIIAEHTITAGLTYALP